MKKETITKKKGSKGNEYFDEKGRKIQTYDEALVDFVDAQMGKLNDCVELAIENAGGNNDRELFILETVFDKVKADMLQFIKDIEERHGKIKLIKVCHPRVQEVGVCIDIRTTLDIEFTPCAEVTA